MYNILLGTCSNRDWPVTFSLAVSALERYVAKKGVKGEKATLIPHHKLGVSCLSQGRQALLNEAINGNFTHLLMIDDDTAFPYNMLDYMIGQEVMGVNIVRKNPEKLMYTAFDFQSQEVQSKDKTGSEEVGRCGLGIILLDIATIKQIPAPHFEVRYNPDTGNYISEDYYFCNKLASYGIRIRINHDVSMNVGHIGHMIYTVNSYQ